MTGDACLLWDEGLTDYDFGPSHPLAPIRLELTIALAERLGVFAGTGSRGAGLAVVEPPVADDKLIGSVHTADYIAAVREAGIDPVMADLAYGLGTSDNPAFPGMHEISARIVGASAEAARRVVEGEVLHAANIAGGLHHAMPDRASGFCVYNDPAVAIARLLDAGCERVAYVDVDVHHGDGVEAIFAADPRVLTISLHEHTSTLFPATGGLPSDTGAEGSAVNVALPPMTTDAGWLRAFHAVVPMLLETFEPAVLVTQHGCDSHALDPLAHLLLSVDGQRAAAVALHELAHRVCGGRWVVTGGGGYALVDVVPRTWTHLLAIVAGAPIDPLTETPFAWREYARGRGASDPPTTMTDGAGDASGPAYAPWSAGYDPGDPVDQAIRLTRRAVFPLQGLDPDC